MINRPARSICATIDQGGIDLWRFDLDHQNTPAWPGVVTQAEFDRGLRLARPRDRARFLQARYCVRTLLGGYVDQAPGALCFAFNAYGKPSLVTADQLGFNLSHSGNLAVLAVGRQRAIGVDLERISYHRDVAALAQQVCSPIELASLTRLPEYARSASFLICWTRKESFLKALGVGLSLDPRHITVGLEPVARHIDDPVDAGCVALRTIEVSDTAVLSLAVRTDFRREHAAICVRQFDQPWDV